jgi:exosortase/archaeosortase family protein
MYQKRIFTKIFIVTAVVLMILPVIVTFSSFLTTVFEKMSWYNWLQNAVVPFESRLVLIILKIFGINGMAVLNKEYSIILETDKGDYLPCGLEWNCLGWQSMLLLGITFITGLSGSYTVMSKIEVIVFGVLGTFLANIFRMVLIIILAYYWNSGAALIVHDYFASFVAIIWMVFFWWFSYRYILEERNYS